MIKRHFPNIARIFDGLLTFTLNLCIIISEKVNKLGGAFYEGD